MAFLVWFLLLVVGVVTLAYLSVRGWWWNVASSGTATRQ